VSINNERSTALLDQPLIYLRLPEVLRRVGLSRSSVFRLIKQGSFPAPVKLSKRASGWPAHLVDAWCKHKLRGSAE
jgi:prophage regulatory protein